MYRKIDKANSLRQGKNCIVINHLENLPSLCTKTGLIRSLRTYYSNPSFKGYKVYDSTPTTFVVLASCQDIEYAKFAQRYHELEANFYYNEQIPAKHCRQNMWLIKPAAENQGRGIEIFKNNIAEMKRFLTSKSTNTYWIIQKYIERPLLYQQRKFDIRMWAIITSKQDMFIYKPGYIRTSSNEYNTESRLNYVHLTNNCLQQFGNKYGQFEDGNTVSFNRFINYLKEQFPNLNIDFERDMLNRMKDLMIDTYLATKKELNPNKRENCFELLGYDFLIDEDFRVWLIEVNTNPYLGIPNKYINWLLPKMINDMLEIVLDPLVSPSNRVPQRIIPNQFELIYSELKGINQRRSIQSSIYPIPELNPTIDEKCDNFYITNKKQRAKEKASFKKSNIKLIIEFELKQIYISPNCEDGEELKEIKHKRKKGTKVKSGRIVEVMYIK